MQVRVVPSKVHSVDRLTLPGLGAVPKVLHRPKIGKPSRAEQVRTVAGRAWTWQAAAALAAVAALAGLAYGGVVAVRKRRSSGGERPA